MTNPGQPDTPDDLAESAAALARSLLDRLGLDLHLRVAREGDGHHLWTNKASEFSGQYRKVVEDGSDPFVRYAFDLPFPILTGEGALVQYPYLDDEARELIAEAAEMTGARFGYSPPRRPRKKVRWNLLSTHWDLRDAQVITRRHGAEITHALVALEHAHGRLKSPLSPQEQRCLQLVAAGARTDRIAGELGISNVTVEMHLRNCRRKLKASTRDQAVALACHNGWIDPGQMLR